MRSLTEQQNILLLPESEKVTKTLGLDQAVEIYMNSTIDPGSDIVNI